MKPMRKKAQQRIVLTMLSLSMVVTSFNFVWADNKEAPGLAGEAQRETKLQISNYAPPVVESQVITINDSPTTYSFPEDAAGTQPAQSEQPAQAEETPVLTEEAKARYTEAGLTAEDIEHLLQTAAGLKEELERVFEMWSSNGRDWDKTRLALLQEKKDRLPDAMQEKYTQELQRMNEAKLDKKERQQLVLLMELRPDLPFEGLLASVREQGAEWIGAELERTKQAFASDLEQLDKHGLTREDVAGLSAYNLRVLFQLAERTETPLSALVANFQQSLGK